MEINFSQFMQDLNDALAHLHDALYQPSTLLCTTLGLDPEESAGPLRALILQAIADLEPSPGIPLDARAQRDFQLLHQRFVLGITQEQTAERMHMSVRSVRRAQREAIYALACILWQSLRARQGWAEDLQEDEGTSSGSRSATVRSTVQQDLLALQSQSQMHVAGVAESIEYALNLLGSTFLRYGVKVQVGQLLPSLIADIHPQLLRQGLVMAMSELARCTASSGEIRVLVVPEDDQIAITLTNSVALEDELPHTGPIENILRWQGGSVEVGTADGWLSLCIKVPAIGQVNVLVIDDNVDLVYFFRRCLTGTKYHIIHADSEQRTLDAFRAIAPDVIVLDILLPDVDGWELLAQFQDNPTLRSIPVIICSIVSAEELALTVGAALYLPKPVKCLRLIQALDQVLDQAAKQSPTAPRNSAAAC